MNDNDLKLIDTNILVYAYDASEGEKHELAKAIDLVHTTGVHF